MPTTMQLGPFEHENVGFATSEMNALGLSYLSRYVVTFDFPGKRRLSEERQKLRSAGAL